jgi:hypothetical protein
MLHGSSKLNQGLLDARLWLIVVGGHSFLLHGFHTGAYSGIIGAILVLCQIEFDGSEYPGGE